MLVLDILDDAIPATEVNISPATPDMRCSLPSVVVDLITVAGGIHDVESQSDAVLLNN